MQLLWFFSLIFAVTAHAVVVDNTASQTTAPANGAPWNNVGVGNGASGVYLKSGWVIGAQHVFAGTTSAVIRFEGVAYSGGTIFVLENPDSTPSDVVMFNIGTTPPGTSEINVSSSTPSFMTNLTMIGYGAKRLGELSDIPITAGSAKGYYWDNSIAITKAWGTNTRTIGAVSSIRAGSNNSLQAFRTSFTANGTSSSAQAAVGDSGGAVFHKSGNAWLLGGTMNAIAGSAGQEANTSVNGNSTFSADMASYASQINNRIAAATTTPTLASVSPDTIAASGSAETLTLSGAHFVSGAQVQMANSNNFSVFANVPDAPVFKSASSLQVALAASTAGTVRLRVVNPDGKPSNSISLTVQPTESYATWLKTYPELTGDSAAATADPDGDGLTNLEEYAFESKPSNASEARRPVSAEETNNGTTFLTLTYEKNTAKSDLTYQAQSSADLTLGWENTADVLVSRTGTIEQRKVSVEIDSGQRFLRVRISR